MIYFEGKEEETKARNFFFSSKKEKKISRYFKDKRSSRIFERNRRSTEKRKLQSFFSFFEMKNKDEKSKIQRDEREKEKWKEGRKK